VTLIEMLAWSAAAIVLLIVDVALLVLAWCYVFPLLSARAGGAWREVRVARSEKAPVVRALLERGEGS
jgi:hypothetical protein